MVLANPNPLGHEANASAADATPAWSIQDSAELYGLERWGAPYFSINPRGHISVEPRGERGNSLDLVDLVEGLQARTSTCPC